MKKLLKKFIPRPVLFLYHYLLSLIGAFYYRWPSRKLIVIGVTGTKGKTTTCYLIYYLLQQLGFKTALSSSDHFYFNEEAQENQSRITMPGRFWLQRFLKTAAARQCEVAVIEVTSEGLMQNRHALIDFDIAVFLNLHPEHIEHHGGFEKYKEAKGKLFESLLRGTNKYLRGKLIKKTISANLDDNEADYFLSFPAQQKITFSLELAGGKYNNNLCPEKFQLTSKGVNFRLNECNFKCKLLGRPNLYNVLAALSVLKTLDLPIASTKEFLALFAGPAGRFEVIAKKGLKVIIDYAHTPASVEELYKNTLSIFKPKRLLCLVGAAGGLRDKWKRPVIGEIAAKYCSHIVVSNEDPFDEDPLVIMRSIEQGVKNYLQEFDFHKDYAVIEDRRDAIYSLLERAVKQDIVVLIGKGAEKTIETKNGPVPWSEKKVVLELLDSLKRKKKPEETSAPRPVGGK